MDAPQTLTVTITEADTGKAGMFGLPLHLAVQREHGEHFFALYIWHLSEVKLYCSGPDPVVGYVVPKEVQDWHKLYYGGEPFDEPVTFTFERKSND